MKKLWLLSVLALLFSACLSSLHPIYTDNNKVVMNELEGEWLMNDDSRWRFEKNPDAEKGYLLTHFDDEQAFLYEAFLVDLDGIYFLDLMPVPSEKMELEMGTLAYFIATHNFLKFEARTDGTMQVSAFDISFLSDLLEQDPTLIKHEKTGDGNIILTASTEELQKFLIHYADNEDAFDESMNLSRIK